MPPDTATGGACDCTGGAACADDGDGTSELWTGTSGGGVARLVVVVVAARTRAVVVAWRPGKARAASPANASVSAPAPARVTVVARRSLRKPVSRELCTFSVQQREMKLR